MEKLNNIVVIYGGSSSEREISLKSGKGIFDAVNQLGFEAELIDYNDLDDLGVLKKYDLVFIAMIIEHVVDSNKFLESIYKVLKPGGIVICVCHNERHFLAKILKEKHPIINDEHVAVFNDKALNLIFKKNKFLDIKVRNLKNYYSLSYWLKMMPIPIIIKNLLNKTIMLIFKKLIIGFKAGNQYLIAKKN